MSYYKFPDFGITHKRIDNNSITNKNLKSLSNFEATSSVSYTSSLSADNMDFSDDLNAHNIDMKEAIKDYIKKLNTDKVIGRKITYKVQDYITNEFKCKIL